MDSHDSNLSCFWNFLSTYGLHFPEPTPRLRIIILQHCRLSAVIVPMVKLKICLRRRSLCQGFRVYCLVISQQVSQIKLCVWTASETPFQVTSPELRLFSPSRITSVLLSFYSFNEFGRDLGVEHLL